MKLLGILRFELAYQARSFWPWLIVVVLLVLDFLMTRDGSLSEVLYVDFFINSPFAIATTTVFGSLVWLLVAGAVAGEAGARDVATGMHPLTYTAPVSKAEYLGGRFLAALVLNALILLAVQAGILLGVYLPGVHPDAIGPFRPAAYLTAYAFISLPNAIAATAIQFSLAARSGRPMAAYVGSFLLFFTGFFIASFLLFSRGLGTLLDPIGIRFIVEDVAHLWTTVEKSWRLLALEGALLINRLLWIGIGVVALALTYWRFRFAHRVESSPLDSIRSVRVQVGGQSRQGRARPAGVYGEQFDRLAELRVMRTRRHVGHHPSATAPAFGFSFHVRQTLAITWASFRAITTSWTGLALLTAIPLMTVAVVLDQMESGGARLTPATILVIGELTGSFSDELSRWLIIPLLIVFFAGELVWRERDAGLGEITDAMPGSDWSPFLGKFLGLGLMVALFMALLTMAGILAQLISGYQNFEIGLYLKIMFGLQLPDYLLFALLALVVHVLVHEKYVGHLVAILAYAFIALPSLFGVEHNLLVYGGGPGWSYTEMRGFGSSLGPWLWFKLYWAAWALLLAVAARLLWVRGRETSFGRRLQWARRRFTRPTAWTAAAAVGLVFTLGGFIFYNTNVLNAYLSASDLADRQAEYERRFGRYAGIPQPRLAGTNLRIEIHPDRREVEIRGSYHLENRSDVAIDSIHVATAPTVETAAITFDRPAANALVDEDLHHRIYALERPLLPGHSLRLDFEVRVASHGFRESGVDTSVVANGTYVTSGWLPAIGYQSRRELVSASDRREHGLAPRPLIFALDDVEAQKDRGGAIAFEAVVGTSEDQVAVAPGALRRTWTEGGRRYFHYVTDAPIGNEYAIVSANYAVREAQWDAVAIRIFHHPQHTANLDGMVRGIQASLDYYTREFGPYPYGHLSFVERPGNGAGMHAEASVITFTEGAALWESNDDPESLNLPFAVVAHEMAHQWTVPYAPVEGAPVMSESLAWYYAMKAVEHARGTGALRRLRRFMRQPYPFAPIRRGEPLLRGLDPYMSYRKGPFALYALSEYIGEAQVNGALRRLLETHRKAEAPLATTRDLYRELQAVNA